MAGFDSAWKISFFPNDSVVNCKLKQACFKIIMPLDHLTEKS